MEIKVAVLSLFIATSLAASSSANAATSFDVNVTGTLEPAACTGSVTDGLGIDYGKIQAQALSADKETLLELKNTGINITCNGPTKLGLRVTDNRPGTAFQEQYSGRSLLGLGTDSSGNKVGGWAAHIVGITTDTGASRPIYSVDNGQTWSLGDVTIIPLESNSNIHTVALNTGTTPTTFTTLNAHLELQPVIAPSSTLDMSQPIIFDGSITLEMVYL